MMSRVRALLGRLTNSTDRRPGDGIARVALISLSFAVGFAAIMAYVLAHPDRIPFIDQER